MNLQSFYPIIVTPHLVSCRGFYQRWFGLEVVFEATWFVLLGSGRAATLAFMHPDHPSAPPGPEAFSGKGMCLEFQVADAASEHERFVCGGAAIELSLRDEPFGQRRFGLHDPAGVWIDVVEQIESAAGWWDKYLLPASERDRSWHARHFGFSFAVDKFSPASPGPHATRLEMVCCALLQARSREPSGNCAQRAGRRRGLRARAHASQA
jgi:catechol 2,3-dioxygenase-like lactoylglutathione lyase family enzyme